jgi:hypothetical protein
VRLLTIAFALAVLGLTGCGASTTAGGSGGTASAERSASTTSVAEARKLSRTLQELNAASAEESAQMRVCRNTPEYASCFKEAGELDTLKIDEAKAVLNGIKPKVGPACRKALTGGSYGEAFLTAQMVGACTADVR